DGVTYAQFTKTLHDKGMAALALVDFVGGVNTIDPGMTRTVAQPLGAGHYVLLCFVETAQHVPHVALGMVRDFLVTGHGTNPAPPTSGTVRMYNYGFSLPATFGHGVYKIVNQGNELHEMAVVRVAAGKTAQDVRQWLLSKSPAGPPPFVEVGGPGALTPGRV